MLQQHGLGARPYDCTLCSLKFFFRAELDHHIVTSHRGRDSTSPGDIQPSQTAGVMNNTDNNETNIESDRRSLHEVRVKDEMMIGEEEDVNVDEQEEDAQIRDQGTVDDENRDTVSNQELDDGKIEAKIESEGHEEKEETWSMHFAEFEIMR